MSKKYVHYKESLAYYKVSNYIMKHIDKKSLIICIGTDKCIGDTLGPLVGTMLKDKNFPIPVFGTLENPIHALNLIDEIDKIKKHYPNTKIIGIDACLGAKDDIGKIIVRNYPIRPGKGVGKTLPEVGDLSIVGVVDCCSDNELFSTRTIRLNLIVNMAKIISYSLINAYYLNNI